MVGRIKFLLMMNEDSYSNDLYWKSPSFPLLFDLEVNLFYSVSVGEMLDILQVHPSFVKELI